MRGHAVEAMRYNRPAIIDAGAKTAFKTSRALASNVFHPIRLHSRIKVPRSNEWFNFFTNYYSPRLRRASYL